MPLPADAQASLLLTIELPMDMDAEHAYDEIGRHAAGEKGATPLRRFIALLEDHALLDHVEFAAPGDQARAAQLFGLREAVPAAVNQRVGQARERLDPRIQKTAADPIVPFDRLEAFMRFCDEVFDRHGLDGAVWGHVSDGNLHPNVIPRSLADVETGRIAMLTIGREAIRLGGAPLAEHGVGRNPVKQRLLIDLYGEEGVGWMRQTKAALDPEWKLAPGVIFPR